MAIKIPSKNIYEMNNPKIRDNLIDNVSVEQTVVTPNNEYEVSVYNESVALDNLVKEENSIKEDFNYEIENDDVSVWYNYGYAYLDNIAKYKEGTITIPKLNGTDYISKIFTEKDEQGNSKIGVSLRGNIITQNTTRTVNWDRKTSPFYSVGSIEYTNKKIEKGKVFEFPQMPIKITSPIMSGQYTGASVSGVSNNTNYTVSVWDDDNNYYISYKILVYLLINQLSGGIIEQADVVFTGSFEASGTYTEYNPEQLEITIYGNTIGIDLTDGSITYIKDQNGNIIQGSGNKPHSLSGNELLQDSGKVNGVAISEHLANNVLTQYTKGKETATLLCDINDYYDYESGEKVIDITGDKMTFALHDEVVPMIYGADHQDKPMSKYQDGTPKVFEVVGSNIIYDGAIWQELTLLEKSQQIT
jgi:hypothetical protein